MRLHQSPAAILAGLLLAPACVGGPNSPDGGATDAGRQIVSDAGAVFDEELGLQAVSLDDGALAGTFAQVMHAGGTIDVPLRGPSESGHDDYNLIVRRWSAEDGRYRQSTTYCGGKYLPVFDLETVVPERAARSLPPSTTETVAIDHGRGTFRVTGQLQLWGLRDLPDPYQTPLPVDVNQAAEPPHAARIFDMDDDGNPGVTTMTRGALEAEVYAIQRKVTDVDGVALSADRVVGHSQSAVEILTLGASVTLLEVPNLQSDVTERDKSWFEERRLDDDADCERVLEAVAAGEVGGARPF